MEELFHGSPQRHHEADSEREDSYDIRRAGVTSLTPDWFVWEPANYRLGFGSCRGPRIRRVKDSTHLWRIGRRGDEVLGCIRPHSALPPGTRNSIAQAAGPDRPVSIVAWWGPPIECLLALARLRREEPLSLDEEEHAHKILRALITGWTEVEPSEPVREQTARVLRLHPLRTADSLQLAAALVWCQGDPSHRDFVCFDQRLREAGRREGSPSYPDLDVHKIALEVI